MEVLEVNTPGELVMWLYLAESEVSMQQGEAEIILDYLKEHNMALAVCSQELMVTKCGNNRLQCTFHCNLLIFRLAVQAVQHFFLLFQDIKCVAEPVPPDYP